MAEDFYVYDNWVRSKAITHRGSCSFCNEGSGLHGKRTTKSSTWHGAYPTASEAREKGRTLKRDRTEDCKICSP